MTVRLRYDLTGTGWAECALEIGGQSASISASYLSDALDDLSRATVDVLSGQPRSEAVFAEEPGEYRWVFDLIGERRLRVRLIDRVITPKNPTETVLVDSECQPREFGQALLAELRRLFELHGEDGYLEKWVRFPFPRDRVRQLRALT